MEGEAEKGQGWPRPLCGGHSFRQEAYLKGVRGRVRTGRKARQASRPANRKLIRELAERPL